MLMSKVKIIVQLKLMLLVIGLFFNTSLSAKEDKGAKRIIALAPHIVEMLFAIGAGDRIVATVEYADFPQAANKIPRIGSYYGIQIEKVVALKPDLIIGWNGGAEIGDLKKLESLGVNITYTQPKNMAQVSRDIIKLGELTGLTQQAETVANNIKNKHTEIKNRYQNKPKVKVFYQIWSD